MLCEEFTVEGLAVLQIQFFRQQRSSLLMASAAVAALRGTADVDAQWAGGDGDLDFVLYDPRTVESMQTKERNVDYHFLTARPMPARKPGETVEQRARALKKWMEACYLYHSADRLPASLRTTAPSLATEHDALVSVVPGTGGRRISGIAAPTTDGGTVLALVVPLLTARDEDVRRTLTETSMLYGKVMRCPWEAHLHSITTAEFDLHIKLLSQRGAPSARQAGHSQAGAPSTTAVVAEHLTVHMTDNCESCASYIPLLQSCLNLRVLPQCGASYESGEGIAGYVPRLEAALYNCLREPLHFLKLTVALSASLGEPVDVAAAVHDLEGGSRGPAQVKGASYCVVDKATRCSFMIGLHYYGGTKLPSVGVVCSQYLAPSHDSLLRRKINYPKDAEQKLSVNADGMFDVAALAAMIATSTIETMAYLLTLCQ